MGSHGHGAKTVGRNASQPSAVHSAISAPASSEPNTSADPDSEDDDNHNDDNSSIHSERPRSLVQSCIAWAVRYRILLEAAGKVIALFLLVVLGLALLLVTLLPPIDPEHAPDVKIPRSFDDLKRLNVVLQIYKQRNFGRVLGSFIAVYLFLQTFSVPGSLYMSILAGAMYGVIFALPLVCLCIATGATLCYLISALLGPALLLASKKWRDRLDLWRARIDAQGGNMISYLMILRIAPLPPHWMVNIICPHLNIGIPLFWASTFLGVLAPSFIHVQVGTTLDQMTSPSEFHLVSLRNILGLSGVVLAVLCPVIVRNIWAKELAEAAEDVVEVTATDSPVNGDDVDGDREVEIIVHDRGRNKRNNKTTENGERGEREEWSSLPNTASIRLEPDSEGHHATPTSQSRRWFSNPFKSSDGQSQGRVRL